jgi:very-short-patch-repair endonuclease
MKEDPEITGRARELRKRMTPAEAILWKELRGRRFAGFKFRRQMPIGIYFADFYCADCLLVLEADGESHLERGNRDEKRDAYFAKQDLKVLRFLNPDIYDDLETVLEVIYRECVERKGKGQGKPREWKPPSSPSP